MSSSTLPSTSSPVQDRTFEGTFDQPLETLVLKAAQPWRMSDGLSLGLYLVDAHSGRVLYANHTFFQLWNIEPLEEPYQRGEGLHATVLQHVLPSECASPESKLDEVVLTGGRTLQRFSSAVRDPHGTVLLWLYVFKDITEGKHTQQALQRSEQSFRKLIESAPESICVHRDQRYVYVNPAMLEALRYTQDSELIGRHFLDIIHPEDREMIRQRAQGIAATGRPAPPQEMRVLRSDGSWFYNETVGLAIEFDGQPSVLVMGRDITERKQMQAQLLQNDRMVTMGTLAAGVGHEINNPLTYVLSNLSLAGEEVEQLSRELEQEAPGLARGRDWGARLKELREMLAEAHTGAERVRTIVRDLKTFSRQAEERRAAVDVLEVLELSLKMASHELRPRARLIKQYEQVPAVHADGTRLGQVFLNLLVNAAQAIPEGSALGSELTVRVHPGPPGRVAVEVSDTGTGIPPELLPRIFDPFFTTKPVGAGTGLGLSICHNIIKSLGGEITVRSEVGRGTTFTVLLQAAPEAAPCVEAAAAGVAGRSAHLLVVDDEPGVGRALARMLGGRHAVTVLESAQEALEQLLSGAPFDAIFCDLMMPGLSGMDLYERLRELKPGLAGRFVFMTGGAFTPRARAFLEAVPSRWIEKPFDAQQLRQLLGQVLREER